MEVEILALKKKTVFLGLGDEGWVEDDVITSVEFVIMKDGALE